MSATSRRMPTRLMLAATLLAVPVMAASGLTTPAIGARSRTAPDTAVTTKFDVDGVTVILRRNTASEVIAANLYLLGGARQITAANAGIEALLLLASERGTRKFPGATVRQRTATLGSTISIEANDDWSAIGLHAIRGTFDSTWAILADRVMAPTLSPGEVEIARDQLVAGARQRATHPDDAR
jgi:zinc protease